MGTMADATMRRLESVGLSPLSTLAIPIPIAFMRVSSASAALMADAITSTVTCCHGTCESQLSMGGSGIMKCVDKQCAAPHAECGGPGRLTLPCCAPEFSCKAQLSSAIMKCM